MSQNNAQNININVELANPFREGEDNYLVIEQGHLHHQFEKITGTNHPHTITWTLTGNASGGEFCALNDPEHPGLKWLDGVPSEKIFHKLEPRGTKQLTVHNHHYDKSSEGEWHYRLFARFGNKVYSVPVTAGAGPSMNTNPSIKNN
ncbi:hypothetical protein DVT68_17235 [Dyella solisilvae]|uniref:Uncharacterized protein n=1 Tax=Dyella solisilvae TaxID=1920168 RepID=A0A370K4C8_9GAMM|nr:hypothetical protein [Dyella solisilvae]RDI97484.1 hypothetical protein DVT68_17235 [Dyella solisilvae]